MVELRTLSPADIHAQLEDFLACAADVPGEYWGASHLLKDLPDKWELSFAAWDGDRVVGYCIASRKAESVHLHHLMVRSERRGEGLGATLLAEFEKRASGRATLKVAVMNERACRFYRQHGWRPILVRDGYVTMEK